MVSTRTCNAVRPQLSAGEEGTVSEAPPMEGHERRSAPHQENACPTASDIRSEALDCN